MFAQQCVVCCCAASWVSTGMLYHGPRPGVLNNMLCGAATAAVSGGPNPTDCQTVVLLRFCAAGLLSVGYGFSMSVLLWLQSRVPNMLRCCAVCCRFVEREYDSSRDMFSVAAVSEEHSIETAAGDVLFLKGQSYPGIYGKELLGQPTWRQA